MKPAKIFFLNHFILNKNGKLDKRKMIEWMNQQEKNDSDLFEGTWLDGQLQKIWSKVLKKEENEIPLNKDFFELGGNSLKLISLTSHINKSFDKQLRFRDLLDASTIQDLRTLINTGNSTVDNVFYRLNSPILNKSPLLLLPPSNGEGLVYKKLANLFDKELEIWTVDYDKGDGVHKVDIQAYSKELAIIWRQEQGSRKCLIGGYSLGFRVAYHMALQMKQRIEKMINIDGILYKNIADEELINQVLVKAEKNKFENKINNIQKDTLSNGINLQKWFFNDYFINTLNIEIQHFIGKESIVINYVPDFVSSLNNVFTIEGNHENVLEIEENLNKISSLINQTK
jgi:acyl carrier protein